MKDEQLKAIKTKLAEVNKALDELQNLIPVDCKIEFNEFSVQKKTLG